MKGIIIRKEDVYVQNIISQDKYTPVVEKAENTVVIQPAASLDKYPYISFKTNCKELYKLSVQLICVKDSGETESRKIHLENA